MLDFLKIKTDKYVKKGIIDIYPSFELIETPKDLMIRGGDFYAIWDEENSRWSTSEGTVIRLIDNETRLEYNKAREKWNGDFTIRPFYLKDGDSKMIDKWHRYVQKQCRDSFVPLDQKLIFSNMKTKKEDYCTKKLDYPLERGNIDSYEKLVSVLYSPEERKKLEWAIGAIVSGDSKNIQKFIVMYGAPKTGKSTMLKIIEMLFDGYWTAFDAKAIGSLSNQFALSPFKMNPLVAIQHDGDLSRIEDNTRLNSIVSHETMLVNEKYERAYPSKFISFLIMGTNKPVKITDAKSGILRRLIDVSPTGERVDENVYDVLMSQIKFELSGIAYHCMEVYKNNKNLYNSYTPTLMMGASNDFYNFVQDNIEKLDSEDGITLTAAYEMYKTYCEEARVTYPYARRAFQEELKNYYREFVERTYLADGTRVRSLYRGFLTDKFDYVPLAKKEIDEFPLGLKEQHSLLDDVLAECPAQYGGKGDKPKAKWAEVTTKLKDLDTSKLHYVMPDKPEHIFIDFDLKDENGNKNFELNYREAIKWPATYAELSKGGEGIHLHYYYTGNNLDVLKRQYAPDIEIKIFSGNASMRRKLSKCNSLAIATISSGLPLKGEKSMVDFKAVQSEKGLRNLIIRNLMKEIHPGTKPSVDFIYKILEDAYNNGLKYDVTDMRPKILTFAANSTHQSEYCLKLVNEMKFKSEEPSTPELNYKDDVLVFFDVEVFPNLFVVVYKAENKDPVKLINPAPIIIEQLLKMKLVGFNCRRYDNHILYARMLGYSNAELFKLSQRIINGSKNAFFGEAYNLSYADIYDFSSKKQSLKKFEIELGIHHQELGLPWDEPVPDNKWELVAEYCVNDVVATEATFKARKQDFVAREMLAKLSGLTVNDTTRMHTTKIIFGNEKKPNLVYTDLSETFPGYTYDSGHSFYRGEETGEGGYVYAEPGMYFDVALLDISSMHPTSIIVLNLFGNYTARFKDILDARLAIKHHDLDTARSLMNGAFAEFLSNEEQADQLAQALKIIINSVYGYTTATFDNPFKDSRNRDNIVAKRGALFMVDLKHAVQEKGFTVAHIKTDSIKIPNATPEIIEFVMEFGKKYGYSFEHEATYSRMCLVNDAVYIAQYADSEKWTATGAQFQVPYVFKKLFSKEPIEFKDLCETKSVSKGEIYLDMNEGLPDVSKEEKERDKLYKKWKDSPAPIRDVTEMLEGYDLVIAKGHDYHYVGRVGQFCPIIEGKGGGVLYRKSDGKYYAVTGTKGYRWLESEMVEKLGQKSNINKDYYDNLVDEAVATISKYGDFEIFVSSDKPEQLPFEDGKIINKPIAD